MRTNNLDVMPPNVRRSLSKFGEDIGIARRKRGLTGHTMAERLGVHKNTYLRVEKGDPSVSMGIYAMALFALGLGPALGDVMDQRKDDTGLLLGTEQLPKRVRVKTEPQLL